MDTNKLKAVGRGLLFIAMLYLFLLSIKMMGGALKFVGKDTVKNLFEGIRNPFVGLFVGILATSILQSSSATTSMAVALMGTSPDYARIAIPIILGANIGTTVTNTLVSMAHITRRQEFRRAFASAIVHDFFNILTVLILFPLECYTHILEKLAGGMAGAFAGVGWDKKLGNPINMITKPVVRHIQEFLTDVLKAPSTVVGWLLLALSVGMLVVALIFLVKLARQAVVGRIGRLFHFLFGHPVRAFLFGLLLTATVQSSSITTSLVVPLVGAGVLTIAQIYPYTLGANVGTTVTALLAALATLDAGIGGLTIAFSHLLFNIVGISIFYPLRVIPISLAKAFSKQVARRRTVALVWVGITFYLIPLLLFLIFR